MPAALLAAAGCINSPRPGYSLDFLVTVRSQLLSLMLAARLLNSSLVTLQSEILSSLMAVQLVSTDCTVFMLSGILEHKVIVQKLAAR